MTFVVAHRLNPFTLAYRATHPSGMRRRSALRAGRRMIDKLRARWDMTPQERAHRYVSQMPIAVLGTTAELR